MMGPIFSHNFEQVPPRNGEVVPDDSQKPFLSPEQTLEDPIANKIPEFQTSDGIYDSESELSSRRAPFFWENNIPEFEQLDEGPNAPMHYFLPRENGQWDNEEGDSRWKPNPQDVPSKSNPENKTWEEILSPYGVDGVDFHGEEPDFSPFSKGTVEIEGFSTERKDNYAKADEALAKQWNEEAKDGRTDWTSADVQQYRHDNKLTWHERSDMKTMDLVPSEIHSNIPHAGGISEAKKQQNEGAS